MSETSWLPFGLTEPNPQLVRERLRQRAQLVQRIRQFFQNRDVVEVDTPALSQYGVSDLHVHNWCAFAPSATQANSASSLPPLKYLQTSPEYAMKRLLAAGSGDIYQLARVFRDDPSGRHHNPEFTLLEWYRIGYNMRQLMTEVDEFLQAMLNCQPAQQVSYQALFEQYLQVDPLADVSGKQLRDRLREIAHVAELAAQETNPTTLQQLAMALVIEPELANGPPTLVFNFPVAQAALARADAEDARVANRFELYYRGIELANGFAELTDADEQARRFAEDNQARQAHDLVPMAADKRLLQALAAGLPTCAGVALGIDRLLLLALGLDHIQAVQTFNSANA